MKGLLWWTTIAVLFLLAVILRQGMLSVFVMVLSLAAGASELWARYCLTNVTYHRHLRDTHLFYGEETELVLEFVNAKPLPLAWLFVQDDFPAGVDLLTTQVQTLAPVLTHRLVSMVALRWYERVTLVHRLQGMQRGRYHLGPARLSSGDVFGFSRCERDDTQVDTLVVYPKIVPLSALSLPAARPLGDWLARKRVMPDPLRFATVREYTPGDNPRYIHWKASARMDVLQTKLFEATDTRTLMVTVDLQTMPRSYEYVPEYLELMLSSAASLIVYALEERYMVGLCMNDWGRSSRGWTHVRPGRRPQQAVELLSLLAGAGPGRGRTFCTMLGEMGSSLLLGATVVAITAQPNEGVQRALVALERTGHPVHLFTVGDEPPVVAQGLSGHHLGGADVWRHLETLELV